MEEIRMNIKNNKNCKITINDEEIAVSEKEKTADEMFKELGYKKENNPEVEIKYIKDENHIIRFWKNSQSIIKQSEDGWYMSITMKELQAINKKCQELGWI